MNIPFVKLRRVWFGLSGLLIILSIVAVAFFGIRLGIDFVGGSLLELQFESAPAVADVRAVVEEAGYTGSFVQSAGENQLLIRTQPLSETEHQVLRDIITETFGKSEELRFDSIGPIIGKELRTNAILAVVLTLLLIGGYVAWAFRKVAQPIKSWKYGVLTIVAAFHDVFIALGAFAVFGAIFGWELQIAFVAAALTILGYSINDTVVVFDRTRENLLKHTDATFGEIVQRSIQQTMTRSIATGLTTLLALMAIFIFGGETTKPFALTLAVGIFVGTYSSVFIASPALVAWELWQNKGNSK